MIAIQLKFSQISVAAITKLLKHRINGHERGFSFNKRKFYLCARVRTWPVFIVHASKQAGGFPDDHSLCTFVAPGEIVSTEFPGMITIDLDFLELKTSVTPRDYLDVVRPPGGSCILCQASCQATWASNIHKSCYEPHGQRPLILVCLTGLNDEEIEN